MSMPPNPILLIMAAGLGNRYGGLKQMDPVGPGGELIIEYSLFDARRAGFERAVIIIRKENEADFRRLLGDRAAKHMDIRYVHQDIRALPEGYALHPGRVKPWGTGHAVLCAAALLDAPFCVINADDFYGAEAFRLCYAHLHHLEDHRDCAMIGYLLKNTLSETGHVSRGLCTLNENQRLTGIVEHTHIIHTVDGPLMTEDMQTYRHLSPDRVVSMNIWGFPAAMAQHLREAFPIFLDHAAANPLEAEFFLPAVVDGLLKAGKATVTVHITRDRWCGVTYREDKPLVQAYLSKLTLEGEYPRPLIP